jgi:hypothetical protein
MNIIHASFAGPHSRLVAFLLRFTILESRLSLLATPLFLIVFLESKLEEMAISTPHMWLPFPYEPQNRPHIGVASSAYTGIEWPSYG